ncbi:putative uncharacterized protein [Firmicutes bacterium CAG:631]|uniref:translational GTPase TypA n=1 Tax=Methanobrevibacter smithii TaxID=2173 RepID=UPI00033E1270|nr:putative uncharacterized protein [Firmicutes bacterium CAG:631]
MLDFKVINIAVIAHVDAGKSTLVDAFLKQSGVFRANEEVIDCVMDSNELERERGITIYSKNCSVQYKDIKINIVDTPGHADFASEIERIIRTVDTVILLVDSSEGPMPQTRFVLSKALEIGLKPILLINKIDKKDARCAEVVDEVFELFDSLNATDEQLDFPILYGIAKQGIVKYELDDQNTDLKPLFETILKHTPIYDVKKNDLPLQMQISTLAYDDYIGRLGIGRVFQGHLKANQEVSYCQADGQISKVKIGKIYVYKGLKRVAVDEIYSGDIAVISGIDKISIGETISDVNHPQPLELIKIEEPTLSMNFCVNTSPFNGRSGKFLTSLQIKARLMKELEVNVGLRVEENPTTDSFKVSGRGELHLSILIEQMRREGYEFAVSRPQVIFHEENGKLYEPMQRVIVNVLDKYSGRVIQAFNIRKGVMEDMEMDGGYTKLTYLLATRSLIGYRNEFTNETHGEGTITMTFAGYAPYMGELPHRANGVLISSETGITMAYSLQFLEERGTLFVPPGEEVYEGQIIGVHKLSNDLTVNPIKNKNLTSVRSAATDVAVSVKPHRVLTLEEALEFIEDDELVEVTPDAIRLRKKYLTKMDRKLAHRS